MSSTIEVDLPLPLASETKLPVLGATVAVLCLYLLYRLLQVGSRDKRLPPGPPTVPILGNLHQIPITGFYKKLRSWGEQYGGVFSLKMGSSTMIVLYDRKAVHDLVDKKGVIYSERPKNAVAEIVTHGDSFAFMDNTPLYRQERKLASHNLSPRILDEKTGPIQDAEISVLMRDLLNTPADFYKHVQRTTCSVACTMVWGQRGPTFESFFGHYSESLEPGANPPIDEFPILKYVPNFASPWRKRAQKSFEAMDQTWATARKYADERRAHGDHRQCIYDRVLEDQKEEQLTEQQLNHFLGVLVEGGADTTASSILTMIACLARNPTEQRKAQRELDEVCGTGRMPNWDDFSKLPYINCIVKEGLRWHPVLPLGVPHRVAKEDWYNGMLIPKDATVVIPTWAIHHSERFKYTDPDEFRPDRYLNHPRLANDYAGSPDFENRDHYGYGAGRRICPGIHLAERTQWRAIAKLLWAFDIELPVDRVTGQKIVPDPHDYKEGISHTPSPFQVIFKPRSQAHIDVINRDVQQNLKTLAQFE